ncbi:hypothetical protein LQW54_012492 [Pestalotiopsis sp. IQ-011]
MAVDFWPSPTIVHDFGLERHSSKKPKGLHYVTESHILVHRWVPEECIESVMTAEDNIDFEKRPSFKDVLEFKSPPITSRKVCVGFVDEGVPDHADGQQPDIEDKLNELALS